MRIAVVMTGRKAGGVEQTAVPYAQALRQQGHEVLLVMAAQSPLLADALFSGLGLARIFWPWGPWYPTNPLHAWQIRRALQRFRPDVVIAHASKGLPQTRAAIGRQVPVLTRSGTTNRKDIIDLLDADHLIVTSDEMAEIAIGIGADRDAVSVVPNFFPGEVFAHDYGRGAPLRIGGLGRLVHRKGFDLLLDAAALLRQRGTDVSLAIAGLGSQLTPLRKKAATLGLNASLLGWVGNGEKVAFLENLDIFICPSRDEPFGNVFIEAMKQGLPIIAADTVGARAIFPDGKGALIVPSGDAAALAAAIARLAGSPDLRAELGRQGQQIYRERFSTDAVAPILDAAVARAVQRFSSAARPRRAGPQPRAASLSGSSAKSLP